MFWHVKHVHGKEAEVGHIQAEVGHSQSEVIGTSSRKDESQDASMEAVLGAISNEDVAGQAHVDLEQREKPRWKVLDS